MKLEVNSIDAQAACQKMSFVTPVTIVHSRAKRYLTADYLRSSCDLKVDLSDM